MLTMQRCKFIYKDSLHNQDILLIIFAIVLNGKMMVKKVM